MRKVRMDMDTTKKETSRVPGLQESGMGESTMNKEQIYDAEIAPLMAQIIDICKTNKIAMLATYFIPTAEADDLTCTTYLPDETGKLPAQIQKCVQIIRPPQVAPMMVTVEHADGSKTMTAIMG